MVELTGTCVFCGVADLISNLGVWFANEARRPVHLECWLVAYEAERDRRQSLTEPRLNGDQASSLRASSHMT